MVVKDIGYKRLLGVCDEVVGLVALGLRKNEWSTVEELVSLIGEMPKNKNYHLAENKEDHFNIIRRCQKIVRETKAAKKLSDEDQNSLANALMGCGRPTETKKVNQMDLTEIKEEVLESVRGLRDDIETHIERIAEHSADYLKPHDRILIWGFSALVASFIEKAVASKSRKTPITLLVSGSSNDAIDYQRILRKQVESKMLQIVVIGDGAAFTVMPIVQKVLIPASSLLPDGSMRTPAGIRALCLAARVHAVPVLALCPLHKISADYPEDECELVQPDHPREIKPAWDLVKSNLVSVVITSEGGLPPNDTYRLHNQLYHPGDSIQ